VIESEAVWDGSMLLPNATAENVNKERDWLSTFSSEEGKLKLTTQALILESHGEIRAGCLGPYSRLMRLSMVFSMWLGTTIRRHRQ
jgi:hypothetical protein